MYDRFQLALQKASKNFVVVPYDEDVFKRLQCHAKKLAKAKKQESGRIDTTSEVTRFTTGLLGEWALEKVLNVSIIDYEIGNSVLYNVPDIPGYTVGIKTVRQGSFPVVPIKNEYPQIICVLTPKAIVICGLASPEVLNNCQDSTELLDPALRMKGSKTCFTGFEYLRRIEKLDDISMYHSSASIKDLGHEPGELPKLRKVSKKSVEEDVEDDIEDDSFEDDED